MNSSKVTVRELIKPIVAGYQLDTTRRVSWDKCAKIEVTHATGEKLSPY